MLGWITGLASLVQAAIALIKLVLPSSRTSSKPKDKECDK